MRLAVVLGAAGAFTKHGIKPGVVQTGACGGYEIVPTSVELASTGPHLNLKR